MGKRFLIVAAAVAPLLCAGTAHAQERTTPAPNGGGGDVTVRAPERMVCRNVTRTSTRMRTSRQCRTVSQMRESERQSQDEVLAEAADTLETLGEKVSTGCVGGMPGRTGGAGPY